MKEDHPAYLYASDVGSPAASGGGSLCFTKFFLALSNKLLTCCIALVASGVRLNRTVRIVAL